MNFTCSSECAMNFTWQLKVLYLGFFVAIIQLCRRLPQWWRCQLGWSSEWCSLLNWGIPLSPWFPSSCSVHEPWTLTLLNPCRIHNLIFLCFHELIFNKTVWTLTSSRYTYGSSTWMDGNWDRSTIDNYYLWNIFHVARHVFFCLWWNLSFVSSWMVGN